MSEELKIGLIVGLTIVAVVAILIIVIWRRKKYIKRCEIAVLSSSEKYRALLQLNEQYHFSVFQNTFQIYRQLNSKQKFDRFNFDKEMMLIIKPYAAEWERAKQSINYNRNLYRRYLDEVNRILSTANSSDAKEYKVSLKNYVKKEEEMFRQNVLSPITDVDYIFDINYTSPQGRKTYNYREIYHMEDISRLLSKVYEEEKQKNSKEYQRKAMTPTMRYNVMKRDGFRCVLCGRSADDGVTLEVDHIIPVSKGGKTVMSNLQTLCWDCNRGKRDRYDEEEINE